MTATSDGCCVMTRMHSAAIGKGLVVKSYMHEGNIPGLDHKWLHGLQAVHVASIDWIEAADLHSEQKRGCAAAH